MCSSNIFLLIYLFDSHHFVAILNQIILSAGCVIQYFRIPNKIKKDPFDFVFYDFRLCSLLGTIFGFVGSEIMSKMNTLRALKNIDTQGHFRTMKSMIAYEREEKLLHRSGYTSGSRTLLRLHRGLGKY